MSHSGQDQAHHVLAPSSDGARAAAIDGVGHPLTIDEDLRRGVVDLSPRPLDRPFEGATGHRPVEIEHLAAVGVGLATREGPGIDRVAKAGEDRFLGVRLGCRRASPIDGHEQLGRNRRAWDLTVYGRQ